MLRETVTKLSKSVLRALFFSFPKNQSAMDVIRSAVPLSRFFDVLKSQRVAGQRPRQGTKSCKIGRNSVRPSVLPSVCLLVHPWACQRALRARCRVLRANLRGLRGQLEGSEGQPEGSEGQPEGSEGQPEGSKAKVNISTKHIFSNICRLVSFQVAILTV